MTEQVLTIDDIIRAEEHAEAKVRSVLLDLERQTGKAIAWVKIEPKRKGQFIEVEINLKD